MPLIGDGNATVGNSRIDGIRSTEHELILSASRQSVDLLDVGGHLLEAGVDIRVDGRNEEEEGVH